MTDLLLITDIPRVRKIFSRLSDDSTRVRIANNLEKGGEELVAEKPTVVFVQTHLSGLSADIILMHLKKLLGRKRTRFVLLATADQVSPETINSYHGHIDISANDYALQTEITDIIATLLKPTKRKSQTLNEIEHIVVVQPTQITEPPLETLSIEQNTTEIIPFALPDLAAQQISSHASITGNQKKEHEPTPAEQGIAYPSRPQLSVYSEFNSSFDSAIETMESPAKVSETLHQQENLWRSQQNEPSTTVPQLNTKRNFLLWLAPVIVVVVVITVLQQKSTKPDIAKTASIAITPEPTKTSKPVAAPTSIQTTKQTTATVAGASPVAVTKLVNPPPTATSTAVPVTVKEAPHALQKAKVITPPHSARLTKLPDFIPRYGYDKNYGKENPGWERYKGQVTEFKILREVDGIKAIQVVDRGGNGVPESFMKGVVRQLVKKPVFEPTSMEKKEGYEIQRGTVSDSQDIVYYRDSDSKKLRGFVVTWR